MQTTYNEYEDNNVVLFHFRLEYHQEHDIIWELIHTVNWELSINFGMVGRGNTLTHMGITWMSVEPVNVAFFIALNTLNCPKIL